MYSPKEGRRENTGWIAQWNWTSLFWEGRVWGLFTVIHITLYLHFHVYTWQYLFCSCFQLAEQSFKEALGDGIWVSIMDGTAGSSIANWSVQYRDQSFFHQLEENVPLELPCDKVTTLFNYARLLEELHDTVKASLLYRLIIFKVLWCHPQNPSWDSALSVSHLLILQYKCNQGWKHALKEHENSETVTFTFSYFVFLMFIAAAICTQFCLSFSDV